MAVVAMAAPAAKAENLRNRRRDQPDFLEDERAVISVAGDRE
jgi:hypothetical protein